MPRSPTTADWFGLLALTALWGTAFLFNELALASFPPSVMVFLRIAIAASVLYAWMRANGVRLPQNLAGYKPMLFMATFGSVVPFQLTAWAQVYIDSAVTGVLMAIMPLFVLTLSHFFIPGARLTPYRAVGFVLGFTGVVLVIGPDSLAGLTGNERLLGALGALGAALSYSIATIYARRLGATNPVQMSAGMMLLAALLIMPAAGAASSAIVWPAGTLALMSVAVLGLLSTGVATVIYFRVIQGPGPVFVSLVNYLVPVWAVLAGALILNESLSAFVYAGLGLILGGIAISELGPRIIAAIAARRIRADTCAMEDL